VELSLRSGAFIPTGSSRSVLDNAYLNIGQLSARLTEYLWATGTFTFGGNHDRSLLQAPSLEVYQYDLGVEARAPFWLERGRWNFTPFAGLGAGGRTYSYRHVAYKNATDADGYGSVGGQLFYRGVGLRVDARDYVSRYQPLMGSGRATTHNDVQLAAGLLFHF
jgi:hypothetical protein